MTTISSATGRTTRPSGVSWSSVLAGAVTGIGVLLALNALWRALGVSSDFAVFADYLDWWYAGTAVAALAIAGGVAGWLTPTGSTGGLMHGITVWGLLLAGTAVLGTGSALATSTLAAAGGDIANAPDSWWPVAVAYGIGFAAAAVGGMIGGVLRAPVVPVRDPDADIELDTSTDRRIDEERALTGRRVPSGRR
jgi:hypothetical protein